MGQLGAYDSLPTCPTWHTNNAPVACMQGGMRRTALHWACQGGHVRIVELLLEHGADTKVWKISQRRPQFCRAFCCCNQLRENWHRMGNGKSLQLFDSCRHHVCDVGCLHLDGHFWPMQIWCSHDILLEQQHQQHCYFASHLGL